MGFEAIRESFEINKLLSFGVCTCMLYCSNQQPSLVPKVIYLKPNDVHHLNISALNQYRSIFNKCALNQNTLIFSSVKTRILCNYEFTSLLPIDKAINQNTTTAKGFQFWNRISRLQCKFVLLQVCILDTSRIYKIHCLRQF